MPDCPICCVPLTDDLAAISTCGHVYHFQCLFTWLKSKKSNTRNPRCLPTQPCPLCRTIFNETGLVKLSLKIPEGSGGVDTTTPKSTGKASKLQEKLQEVMEERDAAEENLENSQKRNIELGKALQDATRASSQFQDKNKSLQRSLDEVRTKLRGDSELLEAAKYWNNVETENGFEHLLKTFHQSTDHKMFLLRLHNMLLEQKKNDKSLVAQVKDWRSHSEEYKRKFEVVSIELNAAKKDIAVMKNEFQKASASKKAHKESEKALRLQLKQIQSQIAATADDQKMQENVAPPPVECRVVNGATNSIFDEFDLAVALNDTTLNLADDEDVVPPKAKPSSKKRDSDFMFDEELMNDVPEPRDTVSRKRWLSEMCVSSLPEQTEVSPETSRRIPVPRSAMGPWAALEEAQRVSKCQKVEESVIAEELESECVNTKVEEETAVTNEGNVTEDLFTDVFEDEDEGKSEGSEVEIVGVKTATYNFPTLNGKKPRNIHRKSASSKPKPLKIRHGKDIRNFFPKAF